MDQQIMLLATQAADSMDTLDASKAMSAALHQQYGSKMNDPRFVEGLLVNEVAGQLRRNLRRTAMDPEANEIPGQESMFPRPHWVVWTNEDGEEIWISGRIATVEQVVNHYAKSEREHRAKARRAAQGKEKSQAMAQYLADHDLDPSQLLWNDAVDNYGNPVLEAMRSAAALTSA